MMADDPKTRQFVSVKELAHILGFHEDTLYRKIERGEIPGVRQYGRDIRIDRVLALTARRRDDDE